jgi:ABC-type polysaccharide/polyol phosphate transport system ATPase subunit
MSKNETAIEFENVSISFPMAHGRAVLRSYIAGWFGRQKSERFHALKGISFRVQKGESVGIVGHNGAGKSTLLRLVLGVAVPDVGRVIVNGRVAPLLELGAGFHPDLTGAENLRLNASLLGISRQRLNDLFRPIVEFSGISDFINEPLRTYSAGMQMRLAFSIAIHMDPDILAVDEVLAVGDQAFQSKCYDRIRKLQRAGKTLLLVSHSTSALQALCDRALWIDHGELMFDGRAIETIEAYEGRLPSRTSTTGS